MTDTMLLGDRIMSWMLWFLVLAGGGLAMPIIYRRDELMPERAFHFGGMALLSAAMGNIPGHGVAQEPQERITSAVAAVQHHSHAGASSGIDFLPGISLLVSVVYFASVAVGLAKHSAKYPFERITSVGSLLAMALMVVVPHPVP
ncbi:hypothetical protein [Gulosibacter chungangensis]|uniref:DUF5134 domain-containing protein n=1 Tax=Gulosibacter chungangensis TaxID=979746 RepID=A0A7J5BH68_9MICO|nr:hypothetical protein [Gulosibacter chungangensis]KAB1644759.1 hypothetical protein F8O05_00290 [Gulosibacter chungangensis]